MRPAPAPRAEDPSEDVPADRPEDVPTRGVEALPVRLLLAGEHATSIRRFVEGTLGWQPVGAAADLVPPALILADAAAAADVAVPREPGAADGRDLDPILPAILLITADDDPRAAAAAASHLPAAVCLLWPDDREALASAAGRVLERPGRPVDGDRDLRIGGAAGGVGTTTVTLALGGILAWSGRSVVVAAHGEVPVAGLADHGSRHAPDDLVGVEVWPVATAVPGIAHLRVLGLSAPAIERLDPGPNAVLVRDLGVATDADVLVLRRDRAGLHALARSTAAVAVAVDAGSASQRALAAAAGRRRVVRVPWSRRVERAGLAGRVPARLPGSWIAGLRPVLLAGGPSGGGRRP